MEDHGAGNGVGGSRNFWTEIEPHRYRVRETLRRIIGDEDTAAQIEQDACTYAEGKYHSDPPSRSLYYWYLRVAVRFALKWLKRQRRLTAYDPQFIARLAEVENEELIDDIRDAFKALPVIERFVLRMLKDYDLSIELVGVLIGKSGYMTKRIEATALEALRASLRQKGHDCYPQERARRQGTHAGSLRETDILNLELANAMIVSDTGPFRSLAPYLDENQRVNGFASKTELCKWIDNITKLSNFDDFCFCDARHQYWNGRVVDPLLIDGSAKGVLSAGRDLVLLNRWWIVLGDPAAIDHKVWEKRMGPKLDGLKRRIAQKLAKSH